MKECRGCAVLESARDRIADDDRATHHVHLRPSTPEDFHPLDD